MLVVLYSCHSVFLQFGQSHKITSTVAIFVKSSSLVLLELEHYRGNFPPSSLTITFETRVLAEDKDTSTEDNKNGKSTVNKDPEFIASTIGKEMFLFTENHSSDLTRVLKVE